jgi:HlyD family secretion protein
VTPVVRGKAIDAVYATGTVEAEERVQIKAKISGTIAAISVRPGSVIKKGDLLARIDNPVVSFELKRGLADLGAAAARSGAKAPQLLALREVGRGIDAELKSARQDLVRLENLAKTGTIAEVELERGRLRVSQLEGSLASNEAQQRAVRIDTAASLARETANVQSLASRVADTDVRAPMDGVVLSKSVEPGEVVAVNQPLFKVGDVGSLILEVSVDEADIGRVRDGRPSAYSRDLAVGDRSAAPASAAAVSLYAFPRRIFHGRVFEVLPEADRERKAFLVKMTIDAPPVGLRSGMAAEVNIITETHENALLVATSAIAADSVWVVRGHRAHRESVEVGLRDLLRAEILSGANEGDKVVVVGQERLTDGAWVQTSVRAADRLEPLPDAALSRQALR